MVARRAQDLSHGVDYGATWTSLHSVIARNYPLNLFWGGITRSYLKVNNPQAYHPIKVLGKNSNMDYAINASTYNEKTME